MPTNTPADLTVTQVQVYSLWDEKSHQRIYRIQLVAYTEDKEVSAYQPLFLTPRAAMDLQRQLNDLFPSLN